MQERQNEIVRLVREHRRLSFGELEALVPGSPATLRRDLQVLAAAGVIIRTHGGVLDPGYIRSEPSFDERIQRCSYEKKRMAALAAEMVPPGASVYVDAGSTCLEVGRLLAARGDVRLVTHSAALVGVALHGGAELLCIGGDLRKVSGAFTGGKALGALQGLRTDIAFIGASGLHPTEGASTTELSEAEMKRTIIRRAGWSILLADGSKWDSPSTVQFAGWQDFGDWVTDAPVRGAARSLRRAGVKVHFAGSLRGVVKTEEEPDES